jgi:hypothetical protein
MLLMGGRLQGNWELGTGIMYFNVPMGVFGFSWGGLSVVTTRMSLKSWNELARDRAVSRFE